MLEVSEAEEQVVLGPPDPVVRSMQSTDYAVVSLMVEDSTALASLALVLWSWVHSRTVSRRPAILVLS